MGSTSGRLHGDSMFGPKFKMVMHCSNLVEGPCLGLIDGTKAKSVWLDVNFENSSCDWMMIHATSQNPKGQDGIHKVASRGRTWGSCLCEALKKTNFWVSSSLMGTKVSFALNSCT